MPEAAGAAQALAAAESNDPCQATLNELNGRALTAFPPSVFWNMPRLAGPTEQARAIGAKLAKHGGMDGLRHAAEIEAALAAGGLPSWRESGRPDA